MKILKGLGVAALIVALAACGGGGGSAPFGGTTPGTGTGTGTGGTGTGGTTPPIIASDLILETSKATVANTGSDTVTITATALNGSRNALAGATVLITTDSDAVLTPITSGTVTGTDGKVQATLSIGANRSNRLITVTVSSGALTRTATVQVAGAKLVGSLVPALVAPGSTGVVQFRLVDQAGSPMPNQSIQVVAAGLAPADITGTTGPSGDYVFSYTAPAAVGSYAISATAGGTSVDPALTLLVQNANTIPDVQTTITSASVSANPSVVGTNFQSATTNRSEIRALFLSAANKPVPNVRVKFDLNGDPNSIGGNFSTGTETLYSDSNGVATTAYIAGTRASPTNGVDVRACYYTTDAEAAADPYVNGKVTTCARSDIVTLTLTSDPLGVSIGTNELVIVNELTYVKKLIVSVVDSAGVAKADVSLVVSLDLPRYRKGRYGVVGDRWEKTSSLACENEDLNRNGVLEGSGSAGEDKNSNDRLDPGKSDVSVTLLQSKTGADGTAELQIQYAKSFGSWVDAKITVAASGVSGTEGRASYEFNPVPVPAAAVSDVNASPAFQFSPYGTVLDCASKD